MICSIASPKLQPSLSLWRLDRRAPTASKSYAAAVPSRLIIGSAEALALSWLQATDLTGNRAGLLLAGDLETSARLVASEPASATALPTMQRLLDLVWSSVTEDLFAAKKQLGAS